MFYTTCSTMYCYAVKLFLARGFRIRVCLQLYLGSKEVCVDAMLPSSFICFISLLFILLIRFVLCYLVFCWVLFFSSSSSIWRALNRNYVNIYYLITILNDKKLDCVVQGEMLVSLFYQFNIVCELI